MVMERVWGMNYRTPKNRPTILALGIAFYILDPIADHIYYRVGLRMHQFPTNADSIGLPLWWSWQGWLLLAPVFAMLLALAVLTYSGGRSFWFFDRARFAWSLFWTVPIAVVCVWDALGAIYNLRWLQVFDLLHATLFVYLLLAVRSSLVGFAFRRHTTSSSSLRSSAP